MDFILTFICIDIKGFCIDMKGFCIDMKGFCIDLIFLARLQMELGLGIGVTNIFENEIVEERLPVAQQEDKVLLKIIDLVKSGIKPDVSDIELKDYRMVWTKLVVDERGVLWKKTPNGRVVVVPSHKVNDVLHHVHGSPLASHYGISKCYVKLVRQFYFPHLMAKLTNHIQSCKPCLRRKMPLRGNKPPVQPIEFDTYDLGGCIGYDFKGPLPSSSKSVLHQCINRYILIVIDYASRYVMAFPTPTMEARVVSEIILTAWIPFFGVPRVIISDRAKYFTGKVMTAIFGALQVDMNLTASYNPQCNGLTEQINRNISNLLGVMLEEEVDEWPKHLKLLFSAYNSTPQCTTGISPNFVVFGRELVQPLDLILNTGAAVNAKSRNVVAELEERLQVRRKALDLLNLRFMEAQDKVRKEQSRKVRGRKVDKFEVGEIVGFRQPPRPNKLYKNYEINHKIIKIIGPATYIIENLDTGFQRVINVRKMRKVTEKEGVVCCEAPGKSVFPLSSELSDVSGDDADDDDDGNDDGDNDGDDDGEIDGEDLNKDADGDRNGDNGGENVREGIEENSVTAEQIGREMEDYGIGDSERDNNVDELSGGRKERNEWRRRLRNRKTLKTPDRLQY